MGGLVTEEVGGHTLLSTGKVEADAIVEGVTTVPGEEEEVTTVEGEGGLNHTHRHGKQVMGCSHSPNGRNTNDRNTEGQTASLTSVWIASSMVWKLAQYSTVHVGP